MGAPPGWVAALDAGRRRLVALVTISPYGLDPTDDLHHLATQPGSFCVASDLNVTVSDTWTGVPIPFWPLLGAWPTVQKRFSPNDRRAEISQVQIEVLADAGLAAALIDTGGGQHATGRVDLWMDGIPLEHVYPLMGGRISGPPTIPRRTGPVTFSLSDGDPDLIVSFPPGPLTREHFPDAPDDVVEVYSRTTIMGPFPERILCPQIDRERRRFYVCDPPATLPPSRVQKGGVDVISGWTTETARSPQGLEYTQIRFDVSVDQITTGLTQEISCSGGMGVMDRNAIEYLLDYGQIRVSTQARAALRKMQSDFPLSVLVNASGDVLSLVRDRFIPQTPYAFTYQRGRADLIQLDAVTPEYRLGPGTGFLFSLTDRPTETSMAGVFNAIEVRCGRDMFASTAGPAPLVRVYRDANHGPTSIRSQLALSERLYGRRFLAVDANDLAVEITSDGRILGCDAGEDLADLLATLHATTHRLYPYLAGWPVGLQLGLNDRVLLTDATESLTEKPTRVTGLSYGPLGVEVELWAESAVS